MDGVRGCPAWVTGLLLVAALLVMVLTVDRLVHEYYAVQSYTELSGETAPEITVGTAARIYPYPWQRAQRQRLDFLLRGDTTRATRAAQMRAVWEAHPRDKALYAAYMLACYRQGNRETFAHEAAHAATVDPQNALYDYLLAKLYLQDALEEIPKKERDPQRKYLRYRVTDRAMLDEAMRLYRRGVQKPYCRAYRLEYAARLTSALPEARHLHHYVMRTHLTMSITMPEFVVYRNMAFANAQYTQILIKEGRQAEAETHLRSWHPFTRQHAEGSQFLLSILVTNAIANIGKDAATEQYRAMGRPDDAARVEREVTALLREVQAYRARDDAYDASVDRMLKRHGNKQAWLLMPVMGDADAVTADTLAPTRVAEYLAMEQSTIALIILWFFLPLPYFGITALRWRMLRHGTPEAPPALLTWPIVIRALGLGLLLPVAFVLLVTELPGIGLHHFGLIQVLIYYAVAGMIPVLAIFILPERLAAKGYDTPLRALLPADTQDTAANFEGLQGIFLLLWMVMAFLLTISIPRCIHRAAEANSVTPLLLWGLCYLGGLVLFGLLPLLWERKHPELGRYFRAKMGAQLTIAAATIVFLGGICAPLMAARERALLRRDTLLFSPQPRLDGPTPLEARVVTHLRDSMLEGLAKAEGE